MGLEIFEVKETVVVDIFKEGEVNIQNDDIFDKAPKRVPDQVSHNKDVIHELEIAKFFEKRLTQKDEFFLRLMQKNNQNTTTETHEEKTWDQKEKAHIS